MHKRDSKPLHLPIPMPKGSVCGCTCGCHNTSHYKGCLKEPKYLPEYKVYACDDCLVICDD